MNRVELIGRITRDPELRYTGNNIATTRFTLAVNRPFQSQNGEQGTDFINIVVWRKQAENVCNFLNKGSLVSIEGRLQTGSYDDKDGNKRYTMEVVADSVQFLESKSQSQGRSNNEPSPYDYQNANDNNVPGMNVSDDPFADFGDSVSIDDNFLD
jgi:single-strand DNA-binding protein